MTFACRPRRWRGLLAGYGVDEAGTSGVIKGRLQLRGIGDTLHDSLATSHGRIALVIPKGTFWTRNVQLAELDIGTFVQKMFQGRLKEPVRINCGLIGFSVRNGVAAADPILIDTEKSVIVGRGGFSFGNEALDLAFRADGKRISIISGQSPVGLTGSFAKPGIDVVSPQLIERAGVGLGSGAVRDASRGRAGVRRCRRCEVGGVRARTGGTSGHGAAHHQGPAARGCRAWHDGQGRRMARRRRASAAASARSSWGFFERRTGDRQTTLCEAARNAVTLNRNGHLPAHRQSFGQRARHRALGGVASGCCRGCSAWAAGSSPRRC